MTIALIDADIVAFRCAVVHETGTLDNAIFEANDMIDRILNKVETNQYKGYLTCRSGNKRKEIDSEYKANRINQPLPRWLHDVKDYLVAEHGCVVSEGIEADDLLGIEQCSHKPFETVICSIDKDLLQVPGRHYNFVKDEWYDVSPLDGLRTFYRQLLTGDRADNILVPFRLGPVKSARLIDHQTEERDMLEVVRSFYLDDDWLERHGKLLWIHQKPDDWWSIPNIRTFDEEMDMFWDEDEGYDHGFTSDEE